MPSLPTSKRDFNEIEEQAEQDYYDDGLEKARSERQSPEERERIRKHRQLLSERANTLLEEGKLAPQALLPDDWVEQAIQDGGRIDNNPNLFDSYDDEMEDMNGNETLENMLDSSAPGRIQGKEYADDELQVNLSYKDHTALPGLIAHGYNPGNIVFDESSYYDEPRNFDEKMHTSEILETDNSYNLGPIHSHNKSSPGRVMKEDYITSSPSPSKPASAHSDYDSDRSLSNNTLNIYDIPYVSAASNASIRSNFSVQSSNLQPSRISDISSYSIKNPDNSIRSKSTISNNTSGRSNTNNLHSSIISNNGSSHSHTSNGKAHLLSSTMMKNKIRIAKTNTSNPCLTTSSEIENLGTKLSDSVEFSSPYHGSQGSQQSDKSLRSNSLVQSKLSQPPSRQFSDRSGLLTSSFMENNMMKSDMSGKIFGFGDNHQNSNPNSPKSSSTSNSIKDNQKYAKAYLDHQVLREKSEKWIKENASSGVFSDVVDNPTKADNAEWERLNSGYFKQKGDILSVTFDSINDPSEVRESQQNPVKNVSLDHKSGVDLRGSKPNSSVRFDTTPQLHVPRSQNATMSNNIIFCESQISAKSTPMKKNPDSSPKSNNNIALGMGSFESSSKNIFGGLFDSVHSLRNTGTATPADDNATLSNLSIKYNSSSRSNNSMKSYSTSKPNSGIKYNSSYTYRSKDSASAEPTPLISVTKPNYSVASSSQYSRNQSQENGSINANNSPSMNGNTSQNIIGNTLSMMSGSAISGNTSTIRSGSGNTSPVRSGGTTPNQVFSHGSCSPNSDTKSESDMEHHDLLHRLFNSLESQGDIGIPLSHNQTPSLESTQSRKRAAKHNRSTSLIKQVYGNRSASTFEVAKANKCDLGAEKGSCSKRIAYRLNSNPGRIEIVTKPVIINNLPGTMDYNCGYPDVVDTAIHNFQTESVINSEKLATIIKRLDLKSREVDDLTAINGQLSEKLVHIKRMFRSDSCTFEEQTITINRLSHQISTLQTEYNIAQHKISELEARLGLSSEEASEKHSIVARDKIIHDLRHEILNLKQNLRIHVHDNKKLANVYQLTFDDNITLSHANEVLMMNELKIENIMSQEDLTIQTLARQNKILNDHYSANRNLSHESSQLKEKNKDLRIKIGELNQLNATLFQQNEQLLSMSKLADRSTGSEPKNVEILSDQIRMSTLNTAYSPDCKSTNEYYKKRCEAFHKLINSQSEAIIKLKQELREANSMKETLTKRLDSNDMRIEELFTDFEQNADRCVARAGNTPLLSKSLNHALTSSKKMQEQKYNRILDELNVKISTIKQEICGMREFISSTKNILKDILSNKCTETVFPIIEDLYKQICKKELNRFGAELLA